MSAEHRPKLSRPVQLDFSLAQWHEVLRLVAEGWIVPLTHGGRIVATVAPEPVASTKRHDLV